MPAKNSIKEYEVGGYYHIYNRGVEKRQIYVDNEDYRKFLSYLKLYLDQPNLQGPTLKDELGRTIPPSRVYENFNEKIELHSYCLMPNHFHLLIKQIDERSMEHFMRALITKYVLYFNKKYKRVGGLFQGKYKCVRILNEQQYTYISKYIHRNPLSDTPTRSDLEGLQEYKYSSYGNYLKLFSQSWVKTEDILSYFSKSGIANSYKLFVEGIGDLKMVYEEMMDLDE